MPEDVDARMLDPEVRRELRSLTRESADLVARHLVMTGRLLDEDPERALAHARAARAMAGRVGVVREAAGVAAYAAGEWTEALAELRAARRITGRPEHLGVMADCERALGRPERALAYADDPAVPDLPQEQRVELVIVLSGARRDLSQADAAVLVLQEPARRTTSARPWAARLWYAFAEALLAAERKDEARSWFEKALQVDEAGETDAGDRLLELDGVVLEGLDEEESDASGEQGMPEDVLAAVVAEAFPSHARGYDPSRVEPRAAGAADPPVEEADAASDDQTADAADAGTGDRAADAADGRADDRTRDADDAPAPTTPTATSLMPLFASPPGADDDEPVG